jgi:thymidylate synthase
MMSYTTDKIKSINFNIDQLKFVINEIKTNPTSRRILMTSFNPSQVHHGVLWPCHSITLQFYVQDEYLDMFCYNRSSDIGLGLPFNIASSSLLLIIIAKLVNLKPRYFNLSLGDAHIYSNHIEPLVEQTRRMPYCFPKIILPEFRRLEEVETLTFKDFKIIEYESYDNIKMEMIA